jgi:hypothetical protein
VLVGFRTAGGAATADQDALNKSFALVNALRSLTHRDDVAESIGWSAVKGEPDANANGFGILVLGAAPQAKLQLAEPVRQMPRLVAPRLANPPKLAPPPTKKTP